MKRASMKRTVRGFLPFALAIAGAGAGCGHSVTYTALNASPRPLAPRTAASVELYMTTQPTRPSVEVGYFEIEQQSPASSGTPAMIAELRTRAGRMGCDALVLTGSTDRIQSYSGQSYGTVHTTSAGPGTMGMGTYQGTSYGTANHVRGHRAVCIVFSDPPGTSPASPPALEGADETKL
jgi:hypothetical protein